MNSDVRFYWSLFLRRLPVMAVIFGICAVIGLGLALTLPARYEASASLLVESPQIPGELAASTVQLPSQEQLEIIEQRLLRRANMIDLANDFAIFEGGPRMNPDEVVKEMRLRTGIGTSVGRNRATLIRLSFSAEDPEIAAGIVNELTTRVLNEDSERRQVLAEQTLEFFEQEVVRLESELAQSSADIIAFKEANADALPENLNFKLDRQSQLLEGIARGNDEVGQLVIQRNRLVELGTTALGSTPVKLTATQRQLVELEAELNSAKLIYSDTNPRIQILEARVEALRAQVAAESGLTVDAPDPAQAVLQVQLNEIAQREERLNEDVARAEAELVTLQDAIARTPEVAIRLDGLERGYANVQSQYNQAVNNLAKAKTGERIEVLSKGQRITVIEQAVPPTEPTSPNRPLIAGGGVILGTALAAGFFLLTELLNRSIRRPSELVSALGVQPLATIPYLETTGGKRRKRAFSTLVILAIVIGVPFALWWVHMNILPLDLILDRIADRLGL